jgi:RNA polymerase sigma-70 factor (ECF subfamily)
MSPSDAGDREARLTEQSRAGSIEAFAELAREHQGAVRAYLARYLRGRDVVEDLAQEVFLAAFRGIGEFRGDAPLRLWLLSIARRQAAMFLRAEVRRREVGGLPEALARWQEETLERDDPRAGDGELRALTACLERLPPDGAELVRSYYFRAEPTARIALRLDKKENTVRVALRRLRQALRICIQQRTAEGV